MSDLPVVSRLLPIDFESGTGWVGGAGQQRLIRWYPELYLVLYAFYNLFAWVLLKLSDSPSTIEELHAVRSLGFEVGCRLLRGRVCVCTSSTMAKKKHETNSTNTRSLVMTIASDDEIEPEEHEESDGEVQGPSKQQLVLSSKANGKKRQRPAGAKGKDKQGRDGPVDPSFCFDAESSLGIAESQAMRGWDFKSE